MEFFDRQLIFVLLRSIGHLLVSANDQALDYIVELSTINQNYVQIYDICIVLLQLESEIKSH